MTEPTIGATSRELRLAVSTAVIALTEAAERGYESIDEKKQLVAAVAESVTAITRQQDALVAKLVAALEDIADFAESGVSLGDRTIEHKARTALQHAKEMRE